MNPLSAYSAYSRTANIGVGPSHGQHSSLEHSVRPNRPTPIADDAVEFIPARIDIASIEQQNYREPNWKSLPKSVQAFVKTEYQDGDNRIGRFLDIYA